MKKNRVFALGATLLLGTVSLAGCGQKGHDIELTLWCASSIKSLTQEQANKWAASIADKYDVGVTVSSVSEQKAAGNMITDVKQGADVFCFAQDQLSRLQSAGALTTIIDQKLKQSIIDDNDESTVTAATIAGNIVAYPMTNDNSYFMYYDKSLFADVTKLENLEDIIDVCQKNNRTIYFETAAWYSAAFYNAVGCHSNWTTDESGKFIDYDDNYSEEGLPAAKAIYNLMVTSGVHVNSSDATAAFSQSVSGKKGGVLISGTWSYNDAKVALGADKLGATVLPKFTVDGETYQMKAFTGAKLMGVKKHEDNVKGALSQLLAQYLTNEDNQYERFQRAGWGPSNKAALNREDVKQSDVLKALAAQKDYSVLQGQFPLKWWDIGDGLQDEIKNSDGSERKLQTALDNYTSEIDKLLGK